MLKKNMGAKDRLIRSTITVALALLAILLNSWLIALIALFVLFESLSSWCIVNQLLGKNTCPLPPPKHISES